MFQHALISASRFFYNLLSQDTTQLLDSASEQLTQTPAFLAQIRPASQVAALRKLSREQDLRNRDVDAFLDAAARSIRCRHDVGRQLDPLGRACEVRVLDLQCLEISAHSSYQTP